MWSGMWKRQTGFWLPTCSAKPWSMKIIGFSLDDLDQDEIFALEK